MQAPKQSSTPRELVPEGNHVARLYGITYIGEINTGYKDEAGEDKYQYKVRLNWELPALLRKFGKEGEEKELPMSVSREVTFSLYKSAKQTAILRTIAQALIGESLTDEEAESFDIDKLIGKPCMIEVTHETHQTSGNKYAKASGFGSIPAGLEVPAQVNESKIFNISEASKEDIEAQPEFIREKMQGSKQYQERFNPVEIDRKAEIKANIDALVKPKPVTEELDESNIPF